jgi:hypothetical protein
MSPSNKSVLEQLFDDNYPPDWIKGALQILDTSWKESREHCRSIKFGPGESRDLISHYCRGRFETELRRHSSKFPGMTAENRLNTPKTYSHTYIKSGNLVLTASAVLLPNRKPRQAEFRSEYNSNGQLELFKSIEQMQAESKEVYALLLYGPPQAEVPSFLRVAFPSKHWVRYIESVDLMARYPGILSTSVSEEANISMPVLQPPQTSPEEKIQKDKRPYIRRHPKRAGQEE